MCFADFTFLSLGPLIFKSFKSKNFYNYLKDICYAHLGCLYLNIQYNNTFFIIVIFVTINSIENNRFLFQYILKTYFIPDAKLNFQHYYSSRPCHMILQKSFSYADLFFTIHALLLLSIIIMHKG